MTGQIIQYTNNLLQMKLTYSHHQHQTEEDSAIHREKILLNEERHGSFEWRRLSVGQSGNR